MEKDHGHMSKKEMKTNKINVAPIDVMKTDKHAPGRLSKFQAEINAIPKEQLSGQLGIVSMSDEEEAKKNFDYDQSSYVNGIEAAKTALV
jgi:hypothetical protein